MMVMMLVITMMMKWTSPAGTIAVIDIRTKRLLKEISNMHEVGYDCLLRTMWDVAT